jgi:hypothetical protein
MGRIPKAEKERALLNESLKNQKSEEFSTIKTNENNLVRFDYKPSSSSSSSSISNNNSPNFISTTTTTTNNISSLISNNYSKYHSQTSSSSSSATSIGATINTNNNKYLKKNQYFDNKYYSNDTKLQNKSENKEGGGEGGVGGKEVALVNKSPTITKTNNDISFNYLINEIDLLFYKHCKKVFQMKIRAENLIKLGKLMNDEDIHFEKQITLQHIWAGLVESIPNEVKNTVGFAKEIPGVSEFKEHNDFAIMIDKRLFDFYLVTSCNQKKYFNLNSYFNLVSLCIFTCIWRIIFAIAKWRSLY